MASVGFLCQISYPDGSTTNLYFDENEQLSRSGEPGQRDHDVRLHGGRCGGATSLSSINTPLVNDWLVQDNGGNPDPSASTTIAYDTTSNWPTTNWATQVELPSPNGAGAPQPTKTYTYNNSATSPCTLPSGAYGSGCVYESDPSPQLVETAGYDSALQETSDTDAMGLTGIQTWDSSDNLRDVDQPAGHGVDDGLRLAGSCD